ncbi:MAG TPA: biopolymer transporter ExbD, partial [Myxococcaceae bacterium]|nr:biopolymer transporter ExbD [Myxococcaceae bacterium]
MAIGHVPGTAEDETDEAVFSEINNTPLTDIFLVLLIIFM